MRAALLCLAVAACHASSAKPSERSRPRLPAFDETAMDKTVDPCADFYQYACGGWLRRTPIPEDRATWGRGFSTILERNEAVLRDVLESNAKGAPDPSDPFWKKTGDFYASCMDEASAGRNGLALVRQELDAVDVSQPAALAKTIARLHLRGAGGLFNFRAGQDYKDATQMIGIADQGGLGLPDRDYYLKSDPREAALRRTYLEHVARMFELAGEPDAKGAAATVLAIETDLAKAAMDKVERRTPANVYHRIDRQGLAAQAPKFAWDVYFEELGAPLVRAINVAVPDFFSGGVNQVLSARPPRELRTYLRWRVIRAAAPFLDARFVAESFRLKQALSGEKEDLPRWKKCVAFTDAALGEALGRSFIAKSFGAEGKTIARGLVEEIESAFRKDLDTLDWMEEPSKAASREKVAKLANMIGFPDKWRDYGKVDVRRDNLLANAMAADAFEVHRRLDEIDKPIDKGEWGMSPPTVNAYYNGSLNEMVFPAGIMQTPFFSPDAPAEANYGGIGMVMGHELTHGFDDRGRQFDGDGNFHEWWTPATTAAFKERAECVARQYDGYVAIDDVHVNGHLTLGENIADIGGLKMAFAAYRAKHEPTNPDVQRFFVAFAQTWCTNYRPEAAELQAKTNPHSNARWRVNGPVSDNPDFERAFACKAGAAMAPPNRCTVW